MTPVARGPLAYAATVAGAILGAPLRLARAGGDVPSAEGRDTPGPPVRRILVVHGTSGLGNLVLLTAFLGALRRAHPGARIGLVLPAGPLTRLLIGPELAEEIFELDTSRGRRRSALALAWQQLRPRRFDLGLSTFSSATTLSAAVLVLAGCRRRVGYAASRWRGMLNTTTLYDDGGHEVERHLRLLGGTVPLATLRPVVALATLPAPAATHGARPLVGLHPGCDRRNAAKRWPVERFVEVAGRLTTAGRADVAVFLGPEDEDLLPAFGALGRRVAIVRGQALGPVAGTLARCTALATNDSGLMHLAAALGVPVVAIFGPSDTTKNAPLGPSTLLTAKVPCRPCHVESPIVCRQPRRFCLEDISVDHVLDALDPYLAAPLRGIG